MNDLSETLGVLDIEYWLNREGFEYKVTRGKSGVQLNVKECPVCGNSNWKVYLNQETGLGNCFHGDCEAKFSKWRFIKAGLGSGLTNREVAEHINAVAAEQGWRPKSKPTERRVYSGALKLPKCFDLPIKGKNLKYLSDRNIDKETCRTFDLKFCMKGWFEYVDPEGQKRYQNYGNRILIPVRDLDGKLVSFQGRDITGTAEKKYLFPPGFASTGTYLYNGDNAIGCVDVVMGEGAFDAMAIYQAFKDDLTLCNVGVIGSFGKHLSHGGESSQMAELLKMKEAGMETLTIMWDGEIQAILDAIDAALMVKSYGVTAKLAILPKGCDPNEVEPEVVREAYGKAIVINETIATKLRIKYRLGKS